MLHLWDMYFEAVACFYVLPVCLQLGAYAAVLFCKCINCVYTLNLKNDLLESYFHENS